MQTHGLFVLEVFAVELKRFSIDEIHPYENNPRINEQAVDAVAESIKQCGYVSPIIVDENGVILAGHTRYKALKKLGYKSVSVAVEGGLSEEKKKKFRLLDNKTSEFASWDFDLLAKELDGLDFGDFDFGFDLGTDEEEPEKEREDAPFSENVSVIVECRNDVEAEAIFNKLTQEGYSCRISTL